MLWLQSQQQQCGVYDASNDSRKEYVSQLSCLGFRHHSGGGGGGVEEVTKGANGIKASRGREPKGVGKRTLQEDCRTRELFNLIDK